MLSGRDSQNARAAAAVNAVGFTRGHKVGQRGLLGEREAAMALKNYVGLALILLPFVAMSIFFLHEIGWQDFLVVMGSTAFAVACLWWGTGLWLSRDEG